MFHSHGGGWVLGSATTHAKLATDVSFLFVRNDIIINKNKYLFSYVLNPLQLWC